MLEYDGESVQAVVVVVVDDAKITAAEMGV